MALRTRGGLLIPETAHVEGIELRKTFKCRTPGCGESWPDSRSGKEAFEAHVGKCAARNIDAIMAESPRVIAPGIYGDSGVDVEFRDWLRKRYHGDGSRRV